jgi:hypothetical protein
MAVSSTYYIDTADFSTATAVWTDTALTTKAPDGYYSFGGNYRQQFEGLLLNVISCGSLPIAITMINFGTDTQLEACADIVTGEPSVLLTTRYSTSSYLNIGDTIYDDVELTTPTTWPVAVYYGYTITPGPTYAWAYVGTDGVVIDSGHCS